MRTARDHSPTKEKLLDAAQRLMLAKGYPATTVDEICDEANLTKGSFFHYFESKEELGKAVLNHFVSSKFEAIRQASFLKKPDPLQRVYGYLDFLIQMSKGPKAQNSCILGSFTQELSDTHPEIRALCEKHFGQWSKAFKQDLDQAKVKHAPKASFDTEGLADHLIAVLEGSLILAKAKRDKAVIENNLKHFKHYVKTIFET